MNLKIAFMSLLVLLVYSCTDAEMEKRRKLGEEVLKVHDEIMLKMQANGELEEKIDLLMAAAEEDTASVLYQRMDEMKQIRLELDNADNAMMDWMANYQYPPDDMSQDSAMAYLNEQMAAIKDVGRQLDEAENKAEELLNSLQKQN